MRSPIPHTAPVVLSIAGSDAGGGAGIQADIKAIEAVGCFATTAITAVTAQNTQGVERTDVLEPSAIRAQIKAVRDDFAVGAVKTGMLATREIVETVSDELDAFDGPVVVDPVMVSETGDRLLASAAVDAYKELINGASLVTPNAHEARVFADHDIEDTASAIDAGQTLLEIGAEAVLLKGGHWSDDPIVDLLLTSSDIQKIVHPRIDTASTHGAGCTLASTVAAHLARGEELESAVESATDQLARSIRHHYQLGAGAGPVNHFVAVRDRLAMPETADTVRSIVQELLTLEIDPLLPEVGMNVVGATPAAESPTDVAAVDGRIVGTLDGPIATGDVRFGASSHVARFLLAIREADPSITFGANVRCTDDVIDAIGELGWDHVEIDREREPADRRKREGRTMDWAADRAMENADTAPVAVYDRGAKGKEAMTRLLAATADELTANIRALADEVA